ncbi:hypothetical protein LEP1GSC037_1455 [Leptospira interrogans str. 2006001854]|uniref:Uncharacterized protein n=1 Tax=Leptospira interrogans str. 2006001854 TaxID=1001590 RepID=M6GIV7_LEPIR|nr:hypothetical protein LEP1GSC037_1455 [Leptospira interrogans str. 2006001854]
MKIVGTTMKYKKNHSPIRFLHKTAVLWHHQNLNQFGTSKIF